MSRRAVVRSGHRSVLISALIVAKNDSAAQRLGRFAQDLILAAQVPDLAPAARNSSRACASASATTRSSRVGRRGMNAPFRARATAADHLTEPCHNADRNREHVQPPQIRQPPRAAHLSADDPGFHAAPRAGGGSPAGPRSCSNSAQSPGDRAAGRPSRDCSVVQKLIADRRAGSGWLGLPDTTGVFVRRAAWRENQCRSLCLRTGPARCVRV